MKNEKEGLETRMLKADLHIHSNYIQKKGEGNSSPKEIIDFYAEKGFEVLAITEHASIVFNKKLVFFTNALKTYKDFKDYAKKKNILLIPGIELFIEGKEVIILNFTGDFTKLKTFQDLKNLKSKNKNTLILAPHPYYKLAQCLEKKLVENIDLFDAIEYAHLYVRFWNKSNKQALATAKKYKKPIIGNSDSHRKFQLNTTYTLINSKKEINSIIKAIKQGKVKLQTHPLSLLDFTKVFFLSLRSAFSKLILRRFY